jgi:uncharacterized protein (TIGR03083 family)
MDLWQEITAQRLALADLLDGLDDAQWRTPSLCSGWTVQAVAAHLIPPGKGGLLEFLPLLVKARGSFARANDEAVLREAQRPRSEIVADLRTHAGSHFAPPLMGPGAPLSDVLVHGLDIRVPLGIDPPDGAWVDVLDFLVGSKARLGFVDGRLPGVRLRASDRDWSHGRGPDVTGSAPWLALAVGGRAVALEHLSGPGLGVFGAWLEA